MCTIAGDEKKYIQKKPEGTIAFFPKHFTQPYAEQPLGASA